MSKLSAKEECYLLSGCLDAAINDYNKLLREVRRYLKHGDRTKLVKMTTKQKKVK